MKARGWPGFQLVRMCSWVLFAKESRAVVDDGPPRSSSETTRDGEDGALTTGGSLNSSPRVSRSRYSPSVHRGIPSRSINGRNGERARSLPVCVYVRACGTEKERATSPSHLHFTRENTVYGPGQSSRPQDQPLRGALSLLLVSSRVQRRPPFLTSHAFTSFVSSSPSRASFQYPRLVPAEEISLERKSDTVLFSRVSLPRPVSSLKEVRSLRQVHDTDIEFS